MALVVEDGTGRADAESNASVAQFKARCDKLGISYVDLTDIQIEQRLRLGFEKLRQDYRTRWAGSRTTTTQAGDWPRDNVPMIDGPGGNRFPTYYANNVIPAEIVAANIDFGVKAGSGDLTPDLEQAIKREKIGPLETEYADYSRATKTYTAIDNLLAPFLVAQGGIRVVRA